MMEEKIIISFSVVLLLRYFVLLAIISTLTKSRDRKLGLLWAVEHLFPP